MSLKKWLINLIKFYQYFISPIFGAKCRYYPTCSTYAIWEFETDNVFRAFYKSFVRILRCNQFFEGGIDYPVVKKEINPIYGKKIKIKYWLIPKKDNKFIVIRADDE